MSFLLSEGSCCNEEYRHSVTKANSFPSPIYSSSPHKAIPAQNGAFTKSLSSPEISPIKKERSFTLSQALNSIRKQLFLRLVRHKIALIDDTFIFDEYANSFYETSEITQCLKNTPRGQFEAGTFFAAHNCRRAVVPLKFFPFVWDAAATVLVKV